MEVSQFTIGEDEVGPFVLFIGRSNKTFKGGLIHRKVEHKNIKHYFTDEDIDRSLQRLYSTYPGIIGEGKFFTRPIAGVLKFSKQNVGMNKLENLMKSMCEKAGLEGNFTNQSGKRTCATSLYQSGLDEQMIMHRTVFRSINGVIKYKRESKEQLKDVSNILNPPSKKMKTETETDSNLFNLATVTPSCDSVPIPSFNKENVSVPSSSSGNKSYSNCNFSFNFTL